MEYSSVDLIEEFHKLTEEKYGLSLPVVRDALHAPWNFLRKEMSSGELPQVKFKYFGKFDVNYYTALKQLDVIEARLKNKSLSEEKYNKIKKMIDKFISQFDND